MQTKTENSTPPEVDEVNSAMNRLLVKENSLRETPKFQSVLEAEAEWAEAQTELSSIQRAQSVLNQEVAQAAGRIESLKATLGELIAKRAMLAVPEKEVEKARQELAAARRIVEEGPLPAPYFKARSGLALQRVRRAQRVIDVHERYHGCKLVMLGETYGGNPAFEKAWRLTQDLTEELGEDARADRAAFMAGLRELRPRDFFSNL